MIMKAIESENSSSSNDQTQSETEEKAEEMRINVLNEME